MVDTRDSKSRDSNIMRVRVSPPVPNISCYNLYMENFTLNIDSDKEKATEKNFQEFVRLREEAEEMRRELNEGKLSTGAQAELESKLSDTNQTIAVLRESLAALGNPDALFVQDAEETLEAEITDPENYYHERYLEKLQEVENLQKERELLFDIVPTEQLSKALEDIEERIEEADTQAQILQAAYRKMIDMKK